MLILLLGAVLSVTVLVVDETLSEQQMGCLKELNLQYLLVEPSKEAKPHMVDSVLARLKGHGMYSDLVMPATLASLYFLGEVKYRTAVYFDLQHLEGLTCNVLKSFFKQAEGINVRPCLRLNEEEWIEKIGDGACGLDEMVTVIGEGRVELLDWKKANKLFYRGKQDFCGEDYRMFS
jgi:hypothetical protein